MTKPTGHPSLSSSVFSDEQWEAWKSHPLCAEENCLSAAEAGPDDSITNNQHGELIRGRVWYQNGTMDGAFPDELRIYCFTCAFWHQCADNDRRHVEDPSAYPNIGVYTRNEDGTLERHSFNESEPIAGPKVARPLGYGGRRFGIKLGSDPVVVTNNLWHQGTIPAWLEYLFAVNAEFVPCDTDN